MNDIVKDNCIILNKCIFGLVQPMMQYYKKAIKILDRAEFSGKNVDPCLCVKKSAKGRAYVTFYADDNLM